MAEQIRDEIALVLQGHLLGEITDNIFAITFGYSEGKLDIVLYLYQSPTIDELDDWGAFATEVSTQVPAEVSADVMIFLVPLRDHPPSNLADWVFMRKDPDNISRIDPYNPTHIDPRSDFAQLSEEAWHERLGEFTE